MLCFGEVCDQPRKVTEASQGSAERELLADIVDESRAMVAFRECLVRQAVRDGWATVLLSHAWLSGEVEMVPVVDAAQFCRTAMGKVLWRRTRSLWPSASCTTSPKMWRSQLGPTCPAFTTATVAWKTIGSALFVCVSLRPSGMSPRPAVALPRPPPPLPIRCALDRAVAALASSPCRRITW